MAIVVDEPKISFPFEEPRQHWALRAGQPERVPTRRPSGYMPGLRTRGGGAGTLLEEEFVQLPLVNDIRDRVRRWREAGHPAATRTTLELLRHCDVFLQFPSGVPTVGGKQINGPRPASRVLNVASWLFASR